MLLCNQSAQLPYLELVGGDWNAIVSLMEGGNAFYSRFYKNRVTYLSPDLYYALKPHRRRLERLDANSMRLLAFLQWVLPFEADLVPDNSLLREFIGGSILREFTV